MNNWIPVSRSMPPNNTKVLVTYIANGNCMKASVKVARFINHDYITDKPKSTVPGRVTHWMPLPAAAW